MSRSQQNVTLLFTREGIKIHFQTDGGDESRYRKIKHIQVRKDMKLIASSKAPKGFQKISPFQANKRIGKDNVS